MTMSVITGVAKPCHALNATWPRSIALQERRAKRKTVQDQEVLAPEGNNREELLQYQKAVLKIKEKSQPGTSRITELFKEGC